MAALYGERIGLHNFGCVLGTLWQELKVACLWSPAQHPLTIHIVSISQP